MLHHKPSEPRIVFTCGRELAYTRNTMLLTTLKQNFTVEGITDSSPSAWLRYIRLALRLIFTPLRDKDLLVVGFYGLPLVFLTRLLSRRPILFDAFISTYDTLCFDRQWIRPGSLAGRFAFWLDRQSCCLATRVLVDTKAQADYFHNTFDVPVEKMKVMFVSCDERLFSPGPIPPEKGLVLFYGSYLPLHGIDTIVRAAHLLENDPAIHFRIIGSGMQSSQVQRLSQELGIHNVEFRPPGPLESLPAEIARAAVCLGGHFGASEKARRVIAGKTFQCLAMGKATIVGDNAANRELLSHGKDAWFCTMDDPQALAEAIRCLMQDDELRERLGRNARETFLQKASLKVLADQMRAILEEMLLHEGSKSIFGSSS